MVVFGSLEVALSGKIKLTKLMVSKFQLVMEQIWLKYAYFAKAIFSPCYIVTCIFARKIELVLYLNLKKGEYLIDWLKYW